MADIGKKKDAPEPTNADPGAKAQPSEGGEERAAQETWERKATRDMLVRCLLSLAAELERAAFEMGKRP